LSSPRRIFVVIAGLDPAIQKAAGSALDCRVKPGNDTFGIYFRYRAIRAIHLSALPP
jgi:hypothetical protein